MKRGVTLKQIAEATGVSVPTVSQILNRRPGNFSSEKTKRKVFEAAKRMQYRQEYADLVRRGDPTNTVAIVCTYDGSSIVDTLTMQLLVCFDEMGFSAYVIQTDGTEECFLHKVKELLVRGVERFVFMNPVRASLAKNADACFAEVIEMIEKCNRTYVMYGGGKRRVVQDFVSAVEETLNFFHSEGRDNFRMVAGVSPDSQRIIGLRKYLKDMPFEEIQKRYLVPLDPRKYSDPDSIIAYGERLTEELLEADPKINALYYMSDLFVLGAVRYLMKKKIAIGKDIALAGFNNMPAVRSFIYPISSAQHDIAALAKHLSEESGRRDDVDILVKPLIFIRRASDPEYRDLY